MDEHAKIIDEARKRVATGGNLNASSFEARIRAVADAYDAMTSRRPYRIAVTHDAALEELRRCAGAQFDPEVVAVFCREAEHASSERGAEAAA